MKRLMINFLIYQNMSSVVSRDIKSFLNVYLSLSLTLALPILRHQSCWWRHISLGTKCSSVVCAARSWESFYFDSEGQPSTSQCQGLQCKHFSSHLLFGCPRSLRKCRISQGNCGLLSHLGERLLECGRSLLSGPNLNDHCPLHPPGRTSLKDFKKGCPSSASETSDNLSLRFTLLSYLKVT